MNFGMGRLLAAGTLAAFIGGTAAQAELTAKELVDELLTLADQFGAKVEWQDMETAADGIMLRDVSLTSLRQMVPVVTVYETDWIRFTENGDGSVSIVTATPLSVRQEWEDESGKATFVYDLVAVDAEIIASRQTDIIIELTAGQYIAEGNATVGEPEFPFRVSMEVVNGSLVLPSEAGDTGKMRAGLNADSVALVLPLLGENFAATMNDLIVEAKADPANQTTGWLGMQTHEYTYSLEIGGSTVGYRFAEGPVSGLFVMEFGLTRLEEEVTPNSHNQKLHAESSRFVVDFGGQLFEVNAGLFDLTLQLAGSPGNDLGTAEAGIELNDVVMGPSIMAIADPGGELPSSAGRIAFNIAVAIPSEFVSAVYSGFDDGRFPIDRLDFDHLFLEAALFGAGLLANGQVGFTLPDEYGNGAAVNGEVFVRMTGVRELVEFFRQRGLVDDQSYLGMQLLFAAAETDSDGALKYDVTIDWPNGVTVNGMDF